jgi:hypothetical protein
MCSFFFWCLILFFFTISYFIFQFDTGFFFRDASMAYILFIGFMRLSTHLVLRILSNPRIYIVVLLYKSLSNPNISIGLYRCNFYTPAPRRGRWVYCFTSVLTSVQDIFRRIFLSNYQWQKSDIWPQASYRYPISWEAFSNPSDSYFLFADFVGFYTH